MFVSLLSSTKSLSFSSFWSILAIVVGLIILLIVSIKYWNSGGKFILLGLFVFGNLLLSGYYLLQINYYYNSEGGIHGVISGILGSNNVEVLDDITFNFKNIELIETGSNRYSATISISDTFNLEGKENIGVFVNELPCSYVEFAGDYIIADYTYSFLDENKTTLCTDTLTLRFAFYENSTELNISTNGGSEAVKYWHYYINKNDFKVSIGKSDYVISEDIEYSNGDISEWCVVTYVVGNDVVYYQPCKVNSVLSFPVLNINHGTWKIDNKDIPDNYIVTEDITIYASEILEHTATFMIGSDIYATRIVETEDYITDIENLFEFKEAEDTYIVVKNWLLDGNVIDLTTQKITSDTIFVADYVKEYLVTITNIVSFTDERVENGIYLNIEIPEYYMLEYFEIQDRKNNLIIKINDLNTYEITQPLFIIPHGEYVYPVEYKVSDSVISSQNVVRYECSVVPNNPTLVGKEFLGWSLDGKTIIDPLQYEIIDKTTFIAVFDDTEFILTLEYFNSDNELVTDTIIGKYQETYTLPIPVQNGFTFYKWEIENGVGLVENGVFVFGSGDCKLIPTWNEIWVNITIPTNLFSSINYGNYVLNNTFESSTRGYTAYELIADRTGSISFVLNIDKGYSVSVTTDGTYNLTQTGNVWVVTWENCNAIDINVSYDTYTQV